MIGVIYVSYIILRLVFLLIVGFCGMSLTSFRLNVNIILLMILFVVGSIFTFVLYYIRDDVRSENFKLLKLMFLALIVFMLSSFGLVIFIG